MTGPERKSDESKRKGVIKVREQKRKEESRRERKRTREKVREQ